MRDPSMVAVILKVLTPGDPKRESSLYVPSAVLPNRSLVVTASSGIQDILGLTGSTSWPRWL